MWQSYSQLPLARISPFFPLHFVVLRNKKGITLDLRSYCNHSPLLVDQFAGSLLRGINSKRLLEQINWTESSEITVELDGISGQPQTHAGLLGVNIGIDPCIRYQPFSCLLILATTSTDGKDRLRRRYLTGFQLPDDIHACLGGNNVDVQAETPIS